MAKWTVNDIPDLQGKVMVVTGANSGIGYESALAFARKGATVVMACRSLEKGNEARAKILRESPSALVEVLALDLGDLASVRAFADAFTANYARLDVLLNNAGVMAVPRSGTVDGFETQFGTNHLGHFALTGMLLPVLLATPGSRVVTTSSGLYTRGRMRFDDLQRDKKYSASGAYADSKLANVLFALELQRRLAAARAGTISVATHPGYAATNLQGHMESRVFRRLALLGNRLQAKTAEEGAVFQIYASVAPEVTGGGFYGPGGRISGDVQNLPINARGRDEADAARLWAISEELTGVRYDQIRNDGLTKGLQSG
jgi:NAD(P)-dependent dehydrogenase (short-subunit alcohol dehydrogenase family)